MPERRDTGMPERRGIGRPIPDPEHAGQFVGRIRIRDAAQLAVTVHCVDRFWERAASSCTTFAAALDRLQTLTAEIGAIVKPPERPDWAAHLDADRFIALGDDILLLVRSRTAVTCVARGGLTRRRKPRKHRRRGRRRGGRPARAAPALTRDELDPK